MTMGKPYTKEGPSAEDKALDLFADMMIERIQSLSGKDGWKKPWFTEGTLQWPKNLNGREYNGMNAMMLLLHCEKEGYKIPRFCTFDRIQQFNKTGKKDEEQKPRVSVLKGEHSFPVMLTTFTVVNKETKEHIKWEDYKLLSQEEREKYNVYPKLQTYHVFNVSQTNLKEVRPEFWEKLEQEYSMPKVEKDEQFAFEPVDRMIADNRWICPIKPMFGDSAYFSISKNAIATANRLKAGFAAKGYRFFMDSPTNQIFLVLENAQLAALEGKAKFGFWEKFDDTHTVVRIATSWATRMDEVEALIDLM